MFKGFTRVVDLRTVIPDMNLSLEGQSSTSSVMRLTYNAATFRKAPGSGEQLGSSHLYASCTRIAACQ